MSLVLRKSVRRCGQRWKLVLGAHAVTRPVGADAIGTRRFGSSTCNRIPRRTLLAISIYSGVIDVKRVFRLEFSSTCVPGQAHPNDLESKSSTSPNVPQTPTAIGTSNMYYTKDRVTRAHEGTHVYVSYLLRRTSQGGIPHREGHYRLSRPQRRGQRGLARITKTACLQAVSRVTSET